MTKAKAKQIAKPTKPAFVKPAPGLNTSAAIQRARAKHDELPLRPFMTAEIGEYGKPQLGPTHSDSAGHSAWLMASLGTTSASFLLQQLNSLEVATAGTTANGEKSASGLNAALAMLGAIDPRDELEGALATQMVGCHSLTMTMLCRAASTNRTDHLELYGNIAVKLQRTFTTQIEALARMRGKGQQTVRVEHVTVHPGGQAIVGNVHHHPPGASGGSPQSKEPPHGSTTPAACPQGSATLLGQDPQGNGLPITSDAERAMPAARRTVARRSRQSKRVQARSVEPRDDRDPANASGDAS